MTYSQLSSFYSKGYKYSEKFYHFQPFIVLNIVIGPSYSRHFFYGIRYHMKNINLDEQQYQKYLPIMTSLWKQEMKVFSDK